VNGPKAGPIAFNLWLGWLLQTPRFAPVRDLLNHLEPAPTFVTGGAVRDFVLDRPSSEVRDIDLLYTGDLDQIWRILRNRYKVTCTAFGNPSVALSDTVHVDIFPPASPLGIPLTLSDALTHSDASGNALGLPIDGSRLLDPTNGYEYLRRGCTRLLELGWNQPPDNNLVALLERVVEQSTRLSLRVVDVEIADQACATITSSSEYLSCERARSAVNAYSTWRHSLERQ
jgi:hypothetical protein